MQQSTITLGSVRVPYLREYLGHWMMETTAFRAGVLLAQRMDIRKHVQERQESPPDGQQTAGNGRAPAAAVAGKMETTSQSVRRGYSYEVTDGVAIVEIAGTLMKHVSSMDESTSTVMLRNTVRQIMRDPNCRACILVIDSPGGTVSGAYDLADDIAQLSAKKPTYAYIEDLGASAAYLQASQTRGISANRNALVGSIGTYGVVYDCSKMYEEAGVKAIVISSGGFKGAGVEGTEITQEQVDEWQKNIDALNGQFVDAVAKGRKLDRAKVEQMADGRVHPADDAKRQKFIDKVETLDQLFARVAQEVNGGAGKAGASQLATIGHINSDDAQDRYERRLDAGVAAGFMDAPDNDPSRCGDSVDEDPNDEPDDDPDDEEKEKGDKQTNPTAAAAKPPDVPAGAGAGAEPGAQNPKKGSDMSQTNTATPPAQAAAGSSGAGAGEQRPATGATSEPKPASIAELEAAFPGEQNALFVLNAAKLAWTMDEAKSAHAVIESRVKANGNGTITAKPGTDPLPSNAASGAASAGGAGKGDGSAKAEFEALVNAKVKNGTPRQRAVSEASRENPELRQSMIDEETARVNRARAR